VHFGTDFVFDGGASSPYAEEDSPNPQSTYGASKLLGDWFAADAPSHFVLRVESLFGGEHRRSSIDRIVAALSAGEPARVFVDRTVTPSYVYDVASATWTLLEKRSEYGLYHCVNTGATTWLGIADRAKRLLGSSAEIVGVRVGDVQLRAKRPQYCALANEKLLRAGIEMPPWEDALERHLQSLSRS
jgi:dTDP-4-dehydrorhamnose reductase